MCMQQQHAVEKNPSSTFQNKNIISYSEQYNPLKHSLQQLLFDEDDEEPHEETKDNQNMYYFNKNQQSNLQLVNQPDSISTDKDDHCRMTALEPLKPESPNKKKSKSSPFKKQDSPNKNKQQHQQQQQRGRKPSELPPSYRSIAVGERERAFSFEHSSSNESKSIGDGEPDHEDPQVLHWIEDLSLSSLELDHDHDTVSVSASYDPHHEGKTIHDPKQVSAHPAAVSHLKHHPVPVKQQAQQQQRKTANPPSTKDVLPCFNLVCTGTCAYGPKCTFLHDPRAQLPKTVRRQAEFLLQSHLHTFRPNLQKMQQQKWLTAAAAAAAANAHHSELDDSLSLSDCTTTDGSLISLPCLAQQGGASKQANHLTSGRNKQTIAFKRDDIFEFPVFSMNPKEANARCYDPNEEELLAHSREMSMWYHLLAVINEKRDIYPSRKHLASKRLSVFKNLASSAVSSTAASRAATQSAAASPNKIATAVSRSQSMLLSHDHSHGHHQQPSQWSLGNLNTVGAGKGFSPLHMFPAHPSVSAANVITDAWH